MQNLSASSRETHRTREIAKNVAVAAASMAMCIPIAAGTGKPAIADGGSDSVQITITAADVQAAAKNRSGLTMKGFGVLSGNSTSALLLDYKAEHPEQYWELINTLFGGEHPIINTIKIEMGNDRNTSTGPNAATMRSRDEYPNIWREPGFQLAADANAVAQKPVHVSLLRWQRPTWVTSDEDQYVWFKNTALAAYREFGYMVDSINPDTNETRTPNKQLYINFGSWVRNDTKGYEAATGQSDPNNGWKDDTERDLWHRVQTIAADTVGTPPTDLGDDIVANKNGLADAVDVVGFHYSSADDSHGNMKKIAEQLDKEVWNSEGQATFSNSADRPNNSMNTTSGSGEGTVGAGTGIGGTNSALEMANWVNTGFDASRRTMTIFQPAIGSFYDGYQYSAKEIISARDPWSGWIYYDAGVAIAQHYTQFATMGWEHDASNPTADGIWRGIPQASASDLGRGNPPSGARDGKKSYLTMAAPDGSDFSTVIVNDSRFTKQYTITADEALRKGLTAGERAPLEIWQTKAASQGTYAENYLKPIAEIQPNSDGNYTFSVEPWSIVTATTLDHAQKHGDALVAREGFGNTMPTASEYTGTDGSGTDGARDVLDINRDGLIYEDDFDYSNYGNVQTWKHGALVDSGQAYLDSRGAHAKPEGTPNVTNASLGTSARYTHDTNGAFESVATDDATHGRVLRQQIGADMAGGAWNGGDPITTIGDMRWSNYTVSTDVLFEDVQGAYATVGVREQSGTASGQNAAAAQLRITPEGTWQLLRFGSQVAQGAIPAEAQFNKGAGVWNTIALRAAGDTYTAYVNGVQVTQFQDNAAQVAGRIQLGSAFTFTQFDNLRVERVPGFVPYYNTLIDGMHQANWSNVSQPVLKYNNQWQHLNGRGMYEYQRSASISKGQGASLTYTFTGTGLDLMGSNDGSAKLDVTVDGEALAHSLPTIAARDTGTEFKLRGLPQGKHTVTLTVANSGTINVDAVGIVTDHQISMQVDTSDLKRAVDDANAVQEGDYHPQTWGEFARARTFAQQALDNPAAYGLDQEGAQALIDRMQLARENLVNKDTRPDVVDLGLVLAVSKSDGLPKTVTIDGQQVAVVWNASANQALQQADVYTEVVLSGVTAAALDDGLKARFTARAEVLPTLEMAYYIDTGAGKTSPVFEAVHAAVPNLRNNVADQLAGEWGHSKNIVTKTGMNIEDKYETGDYATSGTQTYTLPLAAGSYTLTAGIREYWGGQDRPMSVTVSWQEDGKQQRVEGEAFPKLNSGQRAQRSVSFTLAQNAVVTYTLAKQGKNDPILSWLAVAHTPMPVGTLAMIQGKDLPKTVSIGGKSVPVTWNTADAELAKQATSYATLSVLGKVTLDGQQRSISANMEVIPEHLVYWIDSGTNGKDSPQYTAVKALAGKSMLNDAVDRQSPAEDQWGYVAEGMNIKGNTDINDKYSTGLWQGTTRLVYRLPLDAGRYVLTGGFAEWWGMSRNMYHTVQAQGAELAKGSISLSGSTTPLTESLQFTLKEPAVVEYVVTNEGAGGEKPVLSWLAVDRLGDYVPPADKSALQRVVDEAAALQSEDYTESSWSVLAQALGDARSVLDSAQASQADVDAMVKRVQVARESLQSDAGTQTDDPSTSDGGTQTDPEPEPEPGKDEGTQTEPEPEPEPEPDPEPSKDPDPDADVHAENQHDPNPDADTGEHATSESPITQADAPTESTKPLAQTGSVIAGVSVIAGLCVLIAGGLWIMRKRGNN